MSISSLASIMSGPPAGAKHFGVSAKPSIRMWGYRRYGMGLRIDDAGLVLGPGAMVIVVMAPLVVGMVKRIPAAWMIAFGYAVLGSSMWYFGSFNLATDYTREAWARAVQGFGLA